VLAALEAVDLVAIFEEDTPSIDRKSAAERAGQGRRLTREQVVGYEIVEACGGEVVLVDILPGHSTTSLVDRARGGRGERRYRSTPARQRLPSGAIPPNGPRRPMSSPPIALSLHGRRRGCDFRRWCGWSRWRGRSIQAVPALLLRPICALPIALFVLALAGTAMVGRVMARSSYALSPAPTADAAARSIFPAFGLRMWVLPAFWFLTR